MRIDEIKVTPYPYNIDKDDFGSSLEYTTLFTSNDGSEVDVLLYIDDENEGELSFSRGGHVKLTSKGDQFKILFTVVEVIKDMVSMALKDGRMTKLTFSAASNEPSRVKLYKNKVAPMITSLLGDSWSGPVTGNFSEVVEFAWTSSEHVSNDTDTNTNTNTNNDISDTNGTINTVNDANKKQKQKRRNNN